MQAAARSKRHRRTRVWGTTLTSLAILARASLAYATPPLTDPEVAPRQPALPAVGVSPVPEPTAPAITATDGAPSAEGASNAEGAATEDDRSRTRASRFAPNPSYEKNPIDVLPGDVVYPPMRDRPVKLVLWDPEWPRFSTADWIVTGAGAAISLAAAIIPPQSRHVFGGVWIDDDARKALRLPTSEGRYIARDASDVILSLEATWPFFVDALITTWWYRGSPDAAAQMALVNGEALAIVTAVQGATNTIVSRERPYGQICSTPEQPAQTNDCEGNVRYRSFFSGHSAFTFMAAGLICVHHQKLDLLRGGGDTLACVTAYAGAAATATLRVAGDMHYVSDVAIGAVVGTAVGLAVPLLHYRRINRAPGHHAVDMTLIPIGAGLGLGGTF